jgi:hypothetical protein
VALTLGDAIEAARGLLGDGGPAAAAAATWRAAAVLTPSGR